MVILAMDMSLHHTFLCMPKHPSISVQSNPVQSNPLSSTFAVAVVRGKTSPGCSGSRSRFHPAHPPLSPYVAFSAVVFSFQPYLLHQTELVAVASAVCTKAVIQALAGAVWAAWPRHCSLLQLTSPLQPCLPSWLGAGGSHPSLSPCSAS